jgi:predicted protein tyrosine phosphatase
MKKPSRMQQRLAMGSVARRTGGLTYAQLGIGGGIGLSAATNDRLEKEEKENKEALKAPRRVTFMSRAEASSYQFREGEVLISISDTLTEPPALKHQPSDMLALHFNDHVTSMDIELGMRWMRPEDGLAIAEFVRKHTDKRNVIVHCNYGEMRSKAVAMAIAAAEERRVLHVNWRGATVAYREKSDVGNRRVYAITLDSLLHASEEDFA